jgi:hypothetical protein
MSDWPGAFWPPSRLEELADAAGLDSDELREVLREAVEARLAEPTDEGRL